LVGKSSPSSEQKVQHSLPTASSEQRQCIACLTDVSSLETMECPCSHIYCHKCVADLFKSAMIDESLFPPRCCGQKIPLKTTELFLPAELLKEYQERSLEYGTSNRTYCYISTCLAFIPPQCIQHDVATCKSCQCETCSVCKGPYHKDGDCPDDKETKDLLNTAAERKWQRCYSCRRMVELTTGCNHISKAYPLDLCMTVHN
jgi:hypothetical protein